MGNDDTEKMISGNIRSNSWHYKLHMFFESRATKQRFYGPISICQYFWMTIGLILMSIFLGFMTLLISTLVFGYVPYKTITYIVFGGDWTTGFILQLIWSIIGFGIFAVYHEFVKDGDNFSFDINLRKHKTSAEEKEPGILTQWYRAHKQKWCPYIKVV